MKLTQANDIFTTIALDMDDSPIYRLPPELRLYIFELVLAQLLPVKISSRLECRANSVEDLKFFLRGHDNATSLIRTSRQTSAECLPILFACNTFVIDSPLRGWDDDDGGTEQSLCTLYTILHEIKQARPTKVHLTIDLGSYDMRTLTIERDLPEILIELSREMTCFPRGSLLIKLMLEFVPDSGPRAMLSFALDCRELHQSLLTISETLQLQALAYPLERLWLMSVSRQFHPRRLSLGPGLETRR